MNLSETGGSLIGGDEITRLLKNILGSVLVRLAIVGAIAAAVVVLVRPSIDWQRTAESLSQTNWYLLGLASSSVCLLLLARAARWKLILRGTSRVGYLVCLRATVIGFLSITLIPGSGEVSRIAVMRRRSGLPVGLIAGTVLLEKFLDTTILFGFLTLALFFGGSLASFAPMLAMALGAFVAMLLLGVAALSASGLIDRFQRRFAWLTRLPLFGKMTGLVREVEKGLKLVLAGGSKHAMLVLLASLIVHVMGLAPYALTMVAFNLGLPAFALWFLITAINIGLTLPTAPGAVGTYQAVVAGALSLLSVELGLALAFGAVLHLVIYVPLIVFGLIAVFSESIPLRKLGELATGRADDKRGSPEW